MSPVYLQNIQTGLLYFLVAGVALLIPIVTFHYFRFGRVEPRRSFVLYAALLYALVVLVLVFMPFPPIASVCKQGLQSTQWVPFQFVADIQAEMTKRHLSGFGSAITSKSMLSFAFNVALFLPLGVLLRKAYGLQLRWVLLAGFLASLVVEIIQVTGNLGIYPCPYRLFDVDDLMANTLGATLGGLIAPAAVIVPKVLPAKEVLAQLDAVGLPRQIVAYGLDMFLFGFALAFARLGLDRSEANSVWAMLAIFALIRLVCPLLTQGYTPAGRLLKFKVRKVDGTPPKLGALIVREVFGPFGMLVVLIWVMLAFGPAVLELLDRFAVAQTYGLTRNELVLSVALAGTAGFVFFLLTPVFRRDQRAWHDQIAGVRCVLDNPRPDPTTQVEIEEAIDELTAVHPVEGPKAE
ncbi:VanZ family protein [Allokutzneria sp. A3M-2-11 16]|uniref:VanZ family protein n=1 Tax=Allokutzneria sp. A3M-2-11 16 TaxID=2962043 RepID=UPI0020B809BA|nr:VanZ family protein [Allokutzneria sp. A3M-2-11 16]MCP3799419.1 VanZ family protein [Allokutzneria sp. A3M-2-11 16]